MANIGGSFISGTARRRDNIKLVLNLVGLRLLPIIIKDHLWWHSSSTILWTFSASSKYGQDTLHSLDSVRLQPRTALSRHGRISGGPDCPVYSPHTTHYTPHHLPYHTIPYHTISYHTIPYHSIPYHGTVWYGEEQYGTVCYGMGPWSSDDRPGTGLLTSKSAGCKLAPHPCEVAVGLSLVRELYLDQVWRRQRRLKEGWKAKLTKSYL